MAKELVIAHLSDLHLSRFGERVTPTNLLRGRLPKAVVSWSRKRWELTEVVEGWRIEKWVPKNNGNGGDGYGVRLVDPQGARHGRIWVSPGRGYPARMDEAQAKLRSLALVRSKAALSTLCHGALEPQELAHLLTIDPKNTNLCFLQTMAAIRELSPDVVAITGDITDDGYGYELVLCALSDYVDAQRLVVVAGNHDLSAVPPGTRHNMSLQDKNTRWIAFRNAAKLGSEHQGAASQVIDDVFFLGLNSSVRPSRIAFSGRGKVGNKQLGVAAHLIGKVENPRARICCLHHHVAHLRLGPIARADPGQFAMKLSDARQVVELLGAHGFASVLNGHRHHGYHVQEGDLPHVISSPSSTLGCRASGARYFFSLVVVGSRIRVERRPILERPRL